MPNSIDDATRTLKSLRPDNTNFKSAVSASVREAEHRWPMLKNTHPKKFEQTPDLSEEEKTHWLSSEKTSTPNRKKALSLRSSSSNDRLAESLKKMSVQLNKTSPALTPKKDLEVDVIVETQEIYQEDRTAGRNKISELKTIYHTAKVVGNKPKVRDEKNNISKNTDQVKHPPANKTMTESATANASGKKSLRGIFDRLTGNQARTSPVQVAAVKTSVLTKLSKR